MNYRHKLLNQQAKNQIAQKEQEWNQEKNILQQDIINLQNSTDLKLLEQAQTEAKKLQKLLDDTVAILGKEEIKNPTDLTNLLQGKSLKELVSEKDLLNQKIKDQDTALLNLAKQKLTGKKDAEKLLNDLETKWSKREIEWEHEIKTVEKNLSKSRDFSEKLRREIEELKIQIKTKEKKHSFYRWLIVICLASEDVYYYDFVNFRKKCESFVFGKVFQPSVLFKNFDENQKEMFKELKQELKKIDGEILEEREKRESPDCPWYFKTHDY